MDGNAPSTEDTIKYPRMRYAVTRVWADNPRKVVTGLDELAASIATKDIIEPLIVRALEVPDGEITHEVLAGQRRYLAGQKAGLADFPYILRQLDDAEALEIALVENNQRVDPSPLEDAEAIQRRMTDSKHACTAEYLADRLGRPVKWVHGRLALLGLCDEAKAWMRDGKLPITHAQKLAAVDAATQGRVLERFKTASELPAAKQFAHEITYALHLLSGAPFDTNDAKLLGGACAKCPKRSDTQAELFDTGRGETGAHCLDNTCWNGKVTAIWERAQRDAKKRHLDVLTDSDLVRDGYGDDPAYVVWGKPYDVKPAKEGDAPVAVARTPRGVVVELYAKPEKPQRGESDDEYFEDEDGERDEERAEWEKRRAEQDAKRAAEEAERQAETARVLALIPLHRHLFARLALDELAVQLYGPYDLKRILKTLGIDAPEKRESASTSLVKLVPDDVLMDVVIAYAVSSRLNDEDMGDDPPEYERKARELVTGKSVVVPVTRVWIRAEEWDGLGDETRSQYESYGDDKEIEWEGREGFVTTSVGNETLVYLQRISRSYKVTLHEGDELPAKSSKKKARKKAAETEPVSAEVEPPETLTRVWIHEGEWDGLSMEARDFYVAPDIDVDEVEWARRGVFVTAAVNGKTLTMLQGLAKEDNLTLHEGEEPPEPPPSKKKPQKKAEKNVETEPSNAPADTSPASALKLYSYGFAPGCDDDITAQVQKIAGTPLAFLSTVEGDYRWTPAYDKGSDAHTKIAAFLDSFPDKLDMLNGGYIAEHDLTPTEKGTFRGCHHSRCQRRRLQRVEIGPGLYCNACRVVIEGKTSTKTNRTGESTEAPIEQPEATVDEPTKPRPGELVFFKGEDAGHAIERITATHLVVDVDGMEYLVPRDTLSWRSRWQTSETKPETTTLRVSQADWQKHKSGLQDTSTGLLHKKWNAEGEDRVAVFPCGAGIYDRVLQYARKHAIELYVGAREATNRVSPLDPPAAPAKKSRSKKGAK